MACAQRKYLLVPSSPMVSMPKAALRCSASLSLTPWSAATGALTSSSGDLPSYAFVHLVGDACHRYLLSVAAAP
jgi:hypothetical protein